MADTHHLLLYHFVFSTKNRRRWLEPEHQPKIFDYMGGTVRSLGGVSLRVGGWVDHVHLLVKLKTTHCIADFMRDLKAGTSKHFNQSTTSMQKFGWQDGYGAFTVSPFRKDKVIAYIDQQEQHHRTEDSRTEYLRMLDIHGIEYTEKYIDD